MVVLDLHFPTCFHGLMLNYLSTGTTLRFTLSKNLKTKLYKTAVSSVVLYGSFPIAKMFECCLGRQIV
jgi:hypothetical protein